MMKPLKTRGANHKRLPQGEALNSMSIFARPMGSRHCEIFPEILKKASQKTV